MTATATKSRTPTHADAFFTKFYLTDSAPPNPQKFLMRFGFQKQHGPLAFASEPRLKQDYSRILRQVASTNSILTALPNARATRPTVESRMSSA